MNQLFKQPIAFLQLVPQTSHDKKLSFYKQQLNVLKNFGNKTIVFVMFFSALLFLGPLVFDTPDFFVFRALVLMLGPRHLLKIYGLYFMAPCLHEVLWFNSCLLCRCMPVCTLRVIPAWMLVYRRQLQCFFTRNIWFFKQKYKAVSGLLAILPLGVGLRKYWLEPETRDY